MLYVDGDAAEYIWAGLTDEALGQDPPPGMPRPASWLPGHSLPRAQRPLATVRVIGDLERIGRPTGAHMRTSDGTWRATDTTNSLFQLATDDSTLTYPDLLLVNVPSTWAPAPPAASARTRHASKAAARTRTATPTPPPGSPSSPRAPTPTATSSEPPPS